MDTNYFVIGFGLLAVVALALRSVPGLQKAIPTWLAGGVVGVAIGVGAGLAAMETFGYRWEPQQGTPAPVDTAVLAPSGSGKAAGSGPSMGGMPGMGGGMGGMMGGGGGGGGGPQALRELPTLIGKLDLLTSGISIQLSAEQAAKLAKELAKLQDAEVLIEEDAKTHLAAVEAVLTNEQKATLAAIELPRRRSGGGGMPGGQPAAPPGMPAEYLARGKGAAQSPAGSPFRREPNDKHLEGLLSRLDGKPAPKKP